MAEVRELQKGEYYLVSSKKLSGFANETVLRYDGHKVIGRTVYYNFQNEYSLKPIRMTEVLFNKTVICMLPSEHKNKVGKWLGDRKRAKQWLTEQKKNNPNAEITEWDALIATNATIKLEDVVPMDYSKYVIETSPVNTTENKEMELLQKPIRPTQQPQPKSSTYNVVTESTEQPEHKHHVAKPINWKEIGRTRIPGFDPSSKLHEKIAKNVLAHNEKIKLAEHWLIKTAIESNGYGNTITLYVKDKSGKVQRIQPYSSSKVEEVPIPSGK